MELDKTVAVIAICVTVGFCALMGTLASGTINGNKHYYNTASECIAKGGTWLPMNFGSCVSR